MYLSIYNIFRKDCPKSKKTELVEEVLTLISGHSHEVLTETRIETQS